MTLTPAPGAHFVAAARAVSGGPSASAPVLTPAFSARRRGSLDSVAELFRTAFREAPIGMCLVAPDGGFLEVNAAFYRMIVAQLQDLTRQIEAERTLRELWGVARGEGGAAVLFCDLDNFKVVPFSEGLRRELLHRIDLEAELRAAVARKEFLCHYQPLVDLASRQVYGVEALARWRHPVRGLVPPADFLPAIERAGFATAMGEQVMAMAAGQAGTWHRAGRPVTMALNVASQQLTRSLPGAIARLAEEHRLSPDRLCLELTETVLLDAQSEGVSVLHDLAQMA